MIMIPMKVAVSDVLVRMSVGITRVDVPASISAIYRSAPEYDGETAFVPSGEEQIVPTAGFLMQRDITIAPIPSNYGLVTYNGSVITVS